jgi:hypothetical protein
MNTSRPSPWVPASLLRIRCFLNARGMKVRPWLGPREVLAAFHDALKSQERDDAFWTDLGGLLVNLGRDMQVRAEAQGWAAAQELFGAQCYEELLSQIRGALKEQPASGSGLPGFARVLPGRAAALLLMLGAAVSVGCGGETGEGPSSEQATGGADSAASGGATLGGTAGSGGTSSGTVSTGTGGLMTLRPIGTGGVAGGAADPAATPTCNGELAEVIGECDNLTESDKSTLLSCACLLNDAWETGLAALFDTADCNQVIRDYFSCCHGAGARDGDVDTLCNKDPHGLPAEFDPELLADSSCCLLYLGVRCD